MATMTQAGEARRAHKDLTALLDAVSAEHGPARAQKAAELLHTATREGRLDGGTYGRHTTDTTQGSPSPAPVKVACVLGWVTVALSDGTGFGHSPRTLKAYMYDAVGCRVESYVGPVRPGDRPARSRTARNIARWCRQWIKDHTPVVV